MRVPSLKSTLMAVVCLSVFSLAALPELKVSTKNNATITSPAANLYSQAQQTANNCQNHLIFVHNYVPATVITLYGAENPEHNFTVSSGKDSIRGRGNSTWAGDKKPSAAPAIYLLAPVLALIQAPASQQRPFSYRKI